jgi:multidrug transporter EmrE-like cation transporter
LKWVQQVWSRYVAVLLCVILSAGAQLCLKAGMIAFNTFDWSEGLRFGLLHNGSAISGVTWVFAGLSLYVVSMLLWIRTLMRIELSVAYSVLSLNYVLVYLVATQWSRIGETASITRTLGIVIIVLGVMIVMSTADNRDSRRQISE